MGILAGLIVVPAATTPTPASAFLGVNCSGPLFVATGSGNNSNAFLVNKDTGNQSKLISADGADGSYRIPGISFMNQIGLAVGGKSAVFTAKIKNDAGVDVEHLVSMDLTTGAYSLYQTAVTNSVAGAINPMTGLYYWGNVPNGANSGVLNVFNPATGAITYGVMTITVPGSTGGNGDIAFDTDGRMYLTTGGTTFNVYRIDTKVPTSGSVAATGTVIATGELTTSNQFNGIAFGSDGYLYTSSAGGTLYQINPTNGDIIDNVTSAGLSDLASCSDPNRIRVQKNLPQGRYAPGDQFNIEATGSGIEAGNKATTTGSARGIQADVAGPVLGLVGNTYTIAETPAGTTSMSNYTSTWSCVDNASGATISSGSGIIGSFTMPKKTGLEGADVVCTFTNIPSGQLTIQKDLPGGRAKPTDQFTLGLTPGDVKPITTTGTASGIQPEKLTLNGAGAGVTYNFSETPGNATTNMNAYDTTWKCIDTANQNITVKSGTGTSGSVTIPTGQSNPAKVLCTISNAAKGPQLFVYKSVDPASGTTVFPDQVLTYTLTFDNETGVVDAPVNWVDNIKGVLDDATLTEDPKVASGDGITVGPLTDGVFSVTGTVGIGKIATVTYKVTVKADADRGDNVLLNFLLPPGTPPPPICVPPNDDKCTENFVPELIEYKDVDPEDGSVVVPGQTLVYTLTFDNTAGKAPAPVNHVDDLTGVLDDAELTSEPAVSEGSGLTPTKVQDGKFSITGEVATGQVVKVQFSVKVKPDGQRGNNLLTNFLIPPKTEKPEVCVVGDRLCTENPVPSSPAISLVKSAASITDVDGSGTNTAGDIINYSFNVKNTGNVTLFNITLTDPKLSDQPLVCPKTTLQVNEEMVCQSVPYTITAAEAGAGQVNNVATVVGTTSDGKQVTATSPLTVPAVGLLGISIVNTGTEVTAAQMLAALIFVGIGGSLLLVRVRRRDLA